MTFLVLAVAAVAMQLGMAAWCIWSNRRLLA